MIDLRLGDCLEVMKTIEDNSIDAIITDPPYGTTACKWDSVIDFEPMWEQLNRIIKPNGAIVLFGSEPFSSALRMSNIKNYKYDWIWEKSKACNFAQAPNMPLKKIENIIIFTNANLRGINRYIYNPQGVRKANIKQSAKKMSDIQTNKTSQKAYTQKVTNYPYSNLKFKNVGKTLHPTQKPVPLMEYLIKTYTNEKETVLDFTMGSGSTMVACQNTNRNGIGIEMDENYFNIAKQRIEDSINLFNN